MNVQKVNGASKKENQDSYKSLLLLDEISKGEPLSQRELSKRMNVALGLVNSYIKNLVAKGYLRVSNISKNSCKYLLTPKGLAEKTRLAYDLLQDYTRIYRETRTNLKKLFEEMQKDGVRKVVFAGADEVAEIAYLSLQEFDIGFAGIADSDHAGRDFFRYKIMPFEEVRDAGADFVILSSFLRRDDIYRKLIGHGVPSDKIVSIFPIDTPGTGDSGNGGM